MDEKWIPLVTGLLAGLGIGSIVTAWIQHFLKRRESTYESQRKDVEARYKVVILLMYAAFDFQNNKAAMRINRPDLKNQQSVLDELRAGWINMMLFASSNTLQTLNAFIQSPDRENLHKTALSMRSDLGRSSVSIDLLPFSTQPK